MADTKISGLTEDTAPHRTNDFLPSYDASATATKKVRLKNAGVIRLTAGFSASNPADSTTYYFGAFHSTALTTSEGFNKIYIQRAGIITQARWFATTPGGASTENSTLYIRLNGTTDTTVSATATFNDTVETLENTSLSISVSAGDYIECKLVTGSFATNPTSVYGFMEIIQE